MRQADLLTALATRLDSTKTEAGRLLEAVTAVILDAARAGDDVTLQGLGKFAVKETAARIGRNPATGVELEIPASRKLGFTQAKAMKDALNG